MKKALVLDFDGTVIEGNSWEFALKACGNYDETVSGEFFERYMKVRGTEEEKELMKEWIEHDLGLISPGCAKKALDEVKRNVRSGFWEFLEYVKKEGYEIYVSSLGFTPLARELLSSGVNYQMPNIVEENGRYVARSVLTSKDKGRLVRELKKKGYYVVFVGDGPTDEEAMKEADLAISLKHKSKYAISAKDFMEVLDIIKEHGL